MTTKRVDYIPRTRELYAPLAPYQWADNREQAVPWTPLGKPLSECRVALGSSGGVYVAGQEPFHFKDDTSIRLLPSTVDTRKLSVSQFGYPTADAEKDPNCVFPIDRLRELVHDGTVGELAYSAITFMGGIYSQRRVVAELAPRVLDALESEEVDLFYLVPG